MKISLNQTEIELLHQKAIFLIKSRTLVIADFHLGKASHFRKSGIAVPITVYDKNVESLVKLLQWKKPESVVFLGDLFHSHFNNEWLSFIEILLYFHNTTFNLIVGNHDILGDKIYENSPLKIYSEFLDIDKIRFSHDRLETIPLHLYNIYGHLHPSVLLSGKGRQKLKLPCFLFKLNEGILPAFGQFTGLSLQKPEPSDSVYVIAQNKVICVSSPI